MKWIFIVFCVFSATLFFRDQRLPSFITSRLCEEFSSYGPVVRCGGVYFGFRNGIILSDVAFHDPSRKDIFSPVASAKRISVDIFSRRLQISDFKFPRLGDSYYVPGNKERNEPVKITFPDIGPFKLELVSPEILGLTPRRVTADVMVAPEAVDVTEISIVWPDKRSRQALSGVLNIDLVQGRVTGEVSGFSSVEAIRPFIDVLDLPLAVSYMDMFTEVPELVPASCSWDVRLDNGDLKLSLMLKPKLGRYRGVPVDTASGRIDIESWVRGTNLNYRTMIGPIEAVDPGGGVLKGSLLVHGSRQTYDRIELDASSSFPLAGILAITEVITPELIGGLECTQSPVLSFSGTLATCVEDQAANSLKGHCRFPAGSIFGRKFQHAKTDCSYIGDKLTFSSLECTFPDGGVISGDVVLSIPGLDEEKASFTATGTYTNGTLGGISELLAINDDRKEKGTVNAAFSFKGPMNDKCISRLEGNGLLRIADGKLSQMNLFAGLTELLAEKVPGVASIVNQSNGSCTFTIKDGVLRSEDILVEGGLFSIRGKGTISLEEGTLDAVLTVQFFRKDSVLSALVTPITWAFSKLLLEIHLTGTIEEPKWQYISVIDRVL